MKFDQEIEKFIHQNHLLKKSSGKVLVALSGGADSVALLRILNELGYTVEAAHCNFHLRGDESDRDERFVTSLCVKMGITLHKIDFDTKSYADQHKISIEMAARELRYDWFLKLEKDIEAQAVAVAHHLDDSIETFFLNLLRGTGIRGLLGIQAKNGTIVRPLLGVTRADILHYLKELEQDYVTDSTNLQDEYTRNKIRLNLLPMLTSINPNACNNLADTLQHLNEAMKVYSFQIEEGKKRVMSDHRINIHKLLKEPSPEALLHEILSPYNFTSSQVEDIINCLSHQSGKQFISKSNYRVVKDRDELIISKESASSGCDIPQLHYTLIERTPDFCIPHDNHTICVDNDKLAGDFQIRKVKAGDTFIPFGMKGKKKVSDFLTNRKYSLLQKEALWILCSGPDIVWLIGERLDNRFRIDNDTKHILKISLK